MPIVDVSAAASADLVAIATFGIDTFGERQAELYQARLETTFELLAMFPRMGLPTYDLREGLYRFPQK
jgi:plasmid stabilization system protein ParE